MKSDAQIARAAADHIEKVGLNQNGEFFLGHRGRREVPTDVPCCVMGAVTVVTMDDPEHYSKYYRFEDKFRSYIGLSVTRWSDYTPQDEVVETLRRFADEKENG